MLNKIKYVLRRFMSGRNGIDTLSHVIVFIYFILFVVNLFLNLDVLVYIGYVFFVWFLFRTFSKNLRARHKENAWVKARFRSITHLFKSNKRHTSSKSRTKSKSTSKKQTKKKPSIDKHHVIRTCPVCKADLKVRKIKGERYVLCPSCNTEVKIKV